jgi:hypothetical protein
MRPHSRWRRAVVVVVCLTGTAALVLDHPGLAAARGLHYPTGAPAAAGTLPEPGAEQAILRTQPEIPGLTAAGSRQRSLEFLALPATNADTAPQHLSRWPDAIGITSPVLLGLGAARLRAPPTRQSV